MCFLLRELLHPATRDIGAVTYGILRSSYQISCYQHLCRHANNFFATFGAHVFLALERDHRQVSSRTQCAPSWRSYCSA
jgi:hypothetical protein